MNQDFMNSYKRSQELWIKENHIEQKDYVKVFRKYKSNGSDSEYPWIKEMDPYIGKVCQIWRITPEGIYISSKDVPYLCKFPFFSLEKLCGFNTLEESQIVTLDYKLCKYLPYTQEYCNLLGQITKVLDNGYLIEYPTDEIFVDLIYSNYIKVFNTFNALVLVKDDVNSIWIPGIFHCIKSDGNFSYHIKSTHTNSYDGTEYSLCIPFKGNEYLCGSPAHQNYRTSKNKKGIVYDRLSCYYL